jgi:hypothetical protein
MTVPYNNDMREGYVLRNGENHLEVAKRHYALGHERSMWVQLFIWAMREEIYGKHWDRMTKQLRKGARA